MSREAYEVLWVVGAESGHLAREGVTSALATLSAWPNPEFRDFSLSFVEPVKVGSDEGWHMLSTMWGVYADSISNDIITICEETRGDHQVIERLSDSLTFKTACFRVGTISGWPIRIYWEGLGMNFPSQVEGLRRDEPDSWVVTVQLS